MRLLRARLLWTAIAALHVGLVHPCPSHAQRPAGVGTAEVPGQVAEPGSQLRVWLVTAGPGDAVWERYGHNAIRVLDTVTGRDVAYNWGIFDFQQVDFVSRFLRGRMLYSMVPFQAQGMLQAYAQADREVVLQELALTPSQRLALLEFADRNALPENRDYLYQYFLDNCSTRVRDALDLVLGGALMERFGSEATGTSFRFHTRRLTQIDPLVYTGMDLLLGTPTDAPISTWDEMFLPLTLRDALRDMTVLGAAGEEQPLVISEERLVVSTRPSEAVAPPSWFALYALIGLMLGGLMAGSARRPVRDSRALRYVLGAVGVLWSVGAGVIGSVLALLLFTDHEFAWWNENLFLFNPLSLGLGGLILLSALNEEWRPRAYRMALMIVGVAVLGLLWQLAPASKQENAIFFALALPAHLGLAYALRRDHADFKKPAA